MTEYENKRSGHLRILICYTIIESALIIESLLLGWDLTAVLLLFLGLVVSWALHITEILTPDLRLWLYFVLAMLAFFYYGMHETSIYDLAPVMIVIILLMSGTEKHIFVRLCTITYFFTMIYALLFIAGDSIEFNFLTVSRTLLHFVLVCIADQLVKSLLHERTRLKEAMDSKISELEEINHQSENFLVNVSHELRTPINAIIGFASVMLNQEKDKLKRQDILSIQKAGHRLFDQIEDILGYTEIDTGKMVINQDSYMISSVVNDIIVEKQTMAQEALPEIIFDVDPTIPARLMGDGRKIRKILKHLIDNAVKFTPQGAVFVEIFYLQREYGINLCIKVTDTGIGIRKENIKKLSRTFYQLNGERDRSAGGLGLGLPIVYGIVAAMGGFVKIESKEGEGTVISVSIPQKVLDTDYSMSVEQPEELCVVCYMDPKKFEQPEIYNFYNTMISHMAQGLNLSLHKAENETELEHLVSKYSITHLFIGIEEYAERPHYYESLGRETYVVAVTDDIGAIPEHSRVHALKKPFYCLPVIDILNQNSNGGSKLFDMRRMLCPDVRALIVDDEPMNLMVAEGILKGYHMQVKAVNSGEKAIDLCMREEFDLIFLDHMMPGMDGVETLKQLRRSRIDKKNKLIIIAFTANAVSGAREMFLREGFDEFISKPIETIELDRVLKRVLPPTAITYLSDEDEVPSMEAALQETELKEAEAQRLESQEAADLTAVLETMGIHTQSGLSYCQGDLEFYKTLLISFVGEAGKKEENIRNCQQSSDWKNYRIAVHSLKSTSKMIGADELSKLAKAAEDAAKESDGDYIREHTGELLEQYSHIVQCLSDVMRFSDAQREGTDNQISGSQNFTELYKDEFRNNLLELKGYLDTFEAEQAEKRIAKMKGSVYKGEPVETILHNIMQDIENFDLSAASEKTEMLIGTLEGGDA